MADEHASKVDPSQVSDPELKKAIQFIESKGYYVLRFPDRELRTRLLETLTREPKDLYVLTESMYGPEYDAKDQYRVRSCLRRLKEAGLVEIAERKLIRRTYISMWRLKA